MIRTIGVGLPVLTGITTDGILRIRTGDEYTHSGYKGLSMVTGMTMDKILCPYVNLRLKRPLPLYQRGLFTSGLMLHMGLPVTTGITMDKIN